MSIVVVIGAGQIGQAAVHEEVTARDKAAVRSHEQRGDGTDLVADVHWPLA